MTLLSALAEAFRGWADIVANRPNWRDHFTLHRRGLALAIAVYFAVVIVILAVESVLWSVGNPVSVLVGVLVYALPLAGLTISVLATAAILRWQTPVIAMMVPGTYMLIVLFVVQALFGLFVPPALGLGFLPYLIVGVFFFRAGRVVAQMGTLSSIAFAVLTALLLALPVVSLYMLAIAQSGPIGPTT